MPEISFCGQAYTDQTLDANAQACINYYPMRSPIPENPDRVVMYPTPGYASYRRFDYLDGRKRAREVRALFTINDDLYMVYGPYLIKITGGTEPVIGTLYTDTGTVGVTCNTVELIIDDDQYGYVYNLSTGVFTVISGGSFPVTGGVTNFVYIDGYVLAAVNGSKRVIQSDLLDGGTYPALAFADVTSFPDDLVAIYSDQNSVFLFGPKLTEVRFNAGATPFAFEKIPGVLIQAGCAAKRTIKKFGNSFAWLASDENGKAYIATLRGYTPTPLSTPPINNAIQGYATISDAFAYTYREGDNTFYVITFPTEGVTWACEEKTGWWHQRSIDGGADLPTCFAFWNGSNYVGTADGTLSIMSQDYTSALRELLTSPPSTEFVYTPMRRVRSGPHLWADDAPIFLHELRIDIEAGVRTGMELADNVTGLTDPLATLEISRDGGHTWVSAGTATIGKIGEYKKRLIWRKLGRALKFTFRLTVTDPVRSYITGASAKATVGKK